MRVLLVEDDKELGDMIKRVLSVEGYEVEWVQDGFLALKNLSEKDYDLLLLDLMLPRFDGIKICKKVRESKDIPILVITARGQIEDKVEGLQAGADDYITKPFSFKELLARDPSGYEKVQKNRRHNKGGRAHYKSGVPRGHIQR
jgi:Response regulators consisting of a CheY-like receiver domain and a winged-helix DNA-binding domain